ncbi:serine/threonine-protein kinase [Streptomyces turgidiscabies]|uniref:non-specific serine/threonine protein kinase n=1 Tax=Streptomyces turgidiscabies TaxID=85558 RepID=A0ABU0RPZ0_9ACTN|nr:serine/threonine-protein kinase [Streptomyces turgidiscabies]MDQ0934058.1 serine/threonine protein kinase [Streptomyces turgidiscabies]
MGEVFAGRYELADPIGRGGVGAVWRAWDHRRRRYVAAKVLQQSDAHSLLRFVREQALRIDHPHVLAPASWAADDDKVLFTMDLVAGGSLVHLIADYGPLPPTFVCALLDQLLSGLAAVHAEGVVHRDIKPANVLLEATGTGRPRLRLSDFGIAMRLGEPRLTETDYVVGTPGYFAPEQMLGADPDFPSDLFAVGLVALYLLEGAKPDAKALIDYFAEHGTPSAPQGIPEPLWQVVATLLQPDPQARFRTATGARKALAQAAELLPEPGPDDELIEIFDQLGPLPKGFAPTGPLKRSPDVTTSGGRTGGATGTGAESGPATGAGRDEPDALHTGTHTGTHTGPGSARRYDPYREPNSGGTPTGATGGTHTGLGLSPVPGALPGPWHGPIPDPVPNPGNVSPPSGPGTGAIPSRPAGDPAPASPGTGTEPPWPPSGADSAASRPPMPDGTSPSDQAQQAHPGEPGHPTHPAQPAQHNGIPPRPDAAPPRPTHPPAVIPPQPSSMSDTGSFHLPPPQLTAPSASLRHQPEQPSTPPTAVPLPTPAAVHVPPPFEVPSFAGQDFEAPPFEPTPVLSYRPHAPRTATQTQTPTQTPTPTPTRRQDAYASAPSYAVRSPQAPASPQAVPQHRARRRQRRPGPSAKVAIPVLFLAVACYAVGFWALFHI